MAHAKASWASRASRADRPRVDCRLGQPACGVSVTWAHKGPLKDGRTIMGWIVLEAAGALLLLGLVVWWTMFSGRRAGELDEPPDAPLAHPDEADQAAFRGGSKKLKG